VTDERDRPGIGDASTPVGGGRPDGAGVDAILADVVPALAARLRASRLAELEVRTADWRIRIRRDVEGQPAPSRAAPAKPGLHIRGGSALSAATDDDAGAARSPAVGYFLPSAMAEIGRTVRIGDLLGHVEMLGIRHEVPAPVDGVVIRALAAANQAVEYGQPLVLVQASGPTARAGVARPDVGTD
jgi:acetyl-CoA carboxylase biotin carboxyl carrier protein